MKENKETKKQNEVDLLSQKLNRMAIDMGLPEFIKISTVPVRSGGNQIEIKANRSIRVAWGSGLKNLEERDYDLFIRTLAGSISKAGRSVDSVELMKRKSFEKSCITEIPSKTFPANKFFVEELNCSPDKIPCFYGSTYGLNFAELLETKICADFASSKGISSEVIFDTTGNAELKAQEMVVDSNMIIPPSLREEYKIFSSSLGVSNKEKRVNAAKFLLKNKDLTIIPAENLFKRLGNKLTIGKLCLLAKLAGEDPTLFKSLRTSELLKSINESRDGEKILTSKVSEIEKPPGGFTYYAREAVIGAEFPGIFLIPFKMTTHANIYKILESYGALFDLNEKRGAILCPIQKQRIQTRNQASKGSDPFDVTTLAFLANKFPGSYQKLENDFAKSCRVLTPKEAKMKGTEDNKFVIEDYFPL